MCRLVTKRALVEAIKFLNINNFQLCSNMGGQVKLQCFPFHGEHFHFLIPSFPLLKKATKNNALPHHTFD